MYFLENDRRYCRTYNSLEASVQKELVFYQQKAKEWAEVKIKKNKKHSQELENDFVLCFQR